MSRPNIILWTCHDLGCAIGPYGDHTVSTPNLNRLAAEGTTFGANFCTTPLCSPSRGAIQTGRYPHVNGLSGLVNQGWTLPLSELTLSRALADAGYHTMLAGFQHIRRREDFESLGFAEHWPGDGRAETLASLCAERLSSLRAPFYLELNCFEAHRRWDEDDGSVDLAVVTVPPIWPDTPEVRDDLAGLYRHVRKIDAAVGALLDALDAGGLSANTLLVFTVDHGIPFPRCKSTLYDSGLRTALIVRSPGVVPAGRRCDRLVSNIDLCPTLLEAAGLPCADDLDGRSFRDLLFGQTAGPHRQWIFAEKDWHDDFDPMRCVRTERWKYIRNLLPGPLLTLPADLVPGRCSVARALDNAYLAERPSEELYDLHEDPWEQHNLAADESLATTVDDLRAILDDWMHATGDPFLEHGYVPAPARNWLASQRGRQWLPPTR